MLGRMDPKVIANRRRKRTGLPAILIFASFFLFFSFSLMADDFIFRDKMGNEVHLPKGKPIYSHKNPGPWAGLAGIHEPKAESALRKSGLEDVRVLKLTYSHPSSEKDGRIEKIYITDKDGVMIGYKSFDENDKNFAAEFKLNGVINYIRIYTECSRHGLWGAEMRF